MSLIIITRADEVEKILEERQIAAVLSIEHPGVQRGEKGAAPRLTGTTQKILCFWDSEQPVKDGPDLKQVEEGLEFIMSHLQTGDVLVHCHAGKSRSVAVVLGALALQYPDMTENELLETLLVIRPQAAPNILIVEMVDKLAGRDGKLLQAVLGHPVISEQRAKAEYNRQWMLENREDLARKMYPEKFANKPFPPKP